VAAEKARHDEEEKKSGSDPCHILPGTSSTALILHLEPLTELHPELALATVADTAHKGYDGDEYEALLRYVNDHAEKLAHTTGKQQEENEDDVKYTRKWYAPWKKIRVGQSAKEVSPRSSFTIAI